jgi:hypothetical protein
MVIDRSRFRTELENAKSRLANLEGKRDKLEADLEKANTDIEEAKRDIRALAQLAGESEDLALGLSAACKEIFSKTDLTLSQTQVKERLEEMGFPIGEHKHALASIGTTLRRLVQAGYLVPVTMGDGRTGFRRTKTIEPIKVVAPKRLMPSQPKGSGLLEQRLEQMKSDIPIRARMGNKEKK